MMRRRGSRAVGENNSIPFARAFSMPALMKGASFRKRTSSSSGGGGHHRRGRPRMAFEFLARQRKFDVISKILLTHEQKMDPHVLHSWLTEGCVGGETALHKLVRYQPPVRLVHVLIKTLISLHNSSSNKNNSNNKTKSIQLKKISTSRQACFKKEMNLNNDDLPSQQVVQLIPEEARDSFGRTPLHVAAESGCHLHVVDRLLAGTTASMPAIAKDKYGRCPLHWACTNPSGEAHDEMLGGSGTGGGGSRMNFSSWSLLSMLRSTTANTKAATTKQQQQQQRQQQQDDEPSSQPPPLPSTSNSKSEGMDNMASVICRLAAIYPEAASMPDEDGFSPLDLATLSKASPNTLKFLRHAVKLSRGNQYHHPHHHQHAAVDDKSANTHPTADNTAEELPPMENFQCNKAYNFDDDDVSSLGWHDADDDKTDEQRL